MTLHIGPVITPDCYGSLLEVGNPLEVTLPYQSTKTYTGRVQACYNGQYVDVCSNTEVKDDILFAACALYSADYSECTNSVFYCTVLYR